MGPDVSKRKKASDFDPGLLDLLHEYVHGRIDRRGFLDGAQKYAVGGVTALALFEMLKPNYAFAETIKVDDPRIKVSTVTVDSPQGNGKITGQLAMPAKAGKHPAILVIHENRGLNPYVKDVGRRFAVEGYMTFAGDGLTSVGGYPGDDEAGGKLFTTVDRDKMFQDFLAAAKWLKTRPDSTGKLGAVGFCFGGGITNQLAVALGPDLNAGVPFYGGPPKEEDVAKIKAPIMAQHGALDTRLAEGWPAYQKALTAAKVPNEGYIYPNANHGFFNDTTPRYDEAASKLAWTRTLGWFKKYLS
jgi:carboxymethylenebutenolidase